MVYLIFLFSLIPISCTKEEEPSGGNHHYKLSESLYPMLFDKESYWIYKNINTKTIDSISLIEIMMDTIGPFNVGKGYTSTYQVFNLKYSSRIYGEYSEQYVGYLISRGSTNGGYVYLSSFLVGDSSKNASITAIHDSLIINEFLYRNVVEMNIIKDLYIENDMHLFYVDSIGFIKKEIREENNIQVTWEIVNYNIKYLELE
jgi:hypothetical protein